MSLINKILSDLEKRNAFLNENQDVILDGLTSAYDLESGKRSNRFPGIIVSMSVVVLLVVSIILYDLIKVQGFSVFTHFNNLISNSEPEIVSMDENEVVPIISENIKSKIQKRNHFLKLDHDLFLQEIIQSEIAVTETLNRIEAIHLETDSNGISLVMRMPDDIDYLVYGLTNPNRTIVEINNAELGFRFEDLEPIEPIVAIRYSINEHHRFKLILESDKPLSIKRSITSESDNSHDLVVVMEYQWGTGIAESSENSILSDIVDLQINTEPGIIIKGEIIKTPAHQNTNAYAEKLFQQGYTAFKRGKISESLKKLNMSLDQNAGHVNARSTLALILSKQGHLDLAYIPVIYENA